MVMSKNELVIEPKRWVVVHLIMIIDLYMLISIYDEKGVIGSTFLATVINMFSVLLNDALV